MADATQAMDGLAISKTKELKGVRGMKMDHQSKVYQLLTVRRPKSETR